MKSDQFYMAQALRLAALGRYSTQPNPRVGCVIVKHDKVIGQGFHQQSGKPHAELYALEQAGADAKDADVYVSLEPCNHQGKTPPCANALVKAGVKRVVVAMEDPNPKVAGAGLAFLKARGIETKLGICEADAQRLNRGFAKRMLTGRPFVSLKLATSLDGRIAMSSGESAWITSSAARKDVHRLRLAHCAVITGINTVEMDNPRLTSRLDEADLAAEYFVTGRQPIRVIVDRKARLDPKANVCEQDAETWQFVDQDQVLEKTKAMTRVVGLPVVDEKLDLNALLDYLGAQKLNNVMVETGGKLAASFVRAGLVDELIVYQSPDIMGASAQAMLDLPELLKMCEKIEYAYQDVRKIDRDLKLVLRPVAAH